MEISFYFWNIYDHKTYLKIYNFVRTDDYIFFFCRCGDSDSIIIAFNKNFSINKKLNKLIRRIKEEGRNYVIMKDVRQEKDKIFIIGMQYFKLKNVLYTIENDNYEMKVINEEVNDSNLNVYTYHLKLDIKRFFHLLLTKEKRHWIFIYLCLSKFTEKREIILKIMEEFMYPESIEIDINIDNI